MSYKLKENELTKNIKARDNQLDVVDDKIFNRRCWTYLIIGKKGSGKTNLLLNLLDTPIKEGGLKKEFDRIYMVSTTGRKDHKLDELVEELDEQGTYYDELDNDVMKEIMDDMDVFNDNWTKKKKKPHILVIFDDCIHTMPSNRKKGQHFNKFLTTNRHMNASIVILTQRLNELNAIVRSQADIVSFFKTDNKKENDTFIDTYGCPEDIMKTYLKDNHDFITVSFTGKKTKYYYKFDEIEKE